MEFDNSRLYTCVNATELHIGDKVYVGNDLAFIKDWWRHNCHTDVLTEIRTDGWERRFGVEREGEIVYFALAYLVERAEPKTEKEDNMWIYESLPERQEMGVSDHVIVAVEGCPYGQSGYYDYDMQAWFVDGCSEPVNVEAWQKIELPKIEKAEKHYRPFKDTDELIKVWDAKIGTPNWGTAGDLTMPLIWVREKGCNKSADLITCFGSKGITVRGKGMYFDTLFTMFEFLDGTPCGVEE